MFKQKKVRAPKTRVRIIMNEIYNSLPYVCNVFNPIYQVFLSSRL